jgi:hypothetical protein
MSDSGKADGSSKEAVTYIKAGALIDGNGGPVVKIPSS